MVECLDWLDECREAAIIWLAEYQQKLAQRYNRDVKTREFSAGDLVLRKVVGNMRDVGAGKLAQTWEGLYRVTAIVSAGTYYLEDLNERPLPRPWNVHNLKKFYLWPFIHENVSPNLVLRYNQVNDEVTCLSYFWFRYCTLSKLHIKYKYKTLRTETSFSVWSKSPSRWKPYRSYKKL